MSKISPFALRGESVAVSPSGQTLAIATAYDIRLVDTVSKQEVKLTSKRYVLGRDVSFFSNGAFVAATSVKDVVIWDTAKHNEIAVLKHTDMVITTAVSPDDSRIATATSDGTIWLWGVAGRYGYLDSSWGMGLFLLSAVILILCTAFVIPYFGFNRVYRIESEGG